ncbi:hypothetical protein QUA28_19300 [Microcoleus sp. Pol14C4]
MCIHSHKRASQTAPLSPLPNIDRNPKPLAVFSRLSNCSRNTGSCLAYCTMLAISDAEEQLRVLATLWL